MSNQIFVHSDVDDFGLPPSDFRILFHAKRREGGEGCYASVPTIAEICRLNPKTVRTSIKRMARLGIFEIEHRNGQTNILRIRPFSAWQPYPKGYPTQKDTGVSKRVGSLPKRIHTPPTNSIQGDPTQKSIDEDTPLQDTPFKLLPEDTPPVRDFVSEIYQAYPKKVGKKDAFKAIQKSIKEIPAESLLGTVTAYAAAVSGKDLKYIPNPATWFNRGSYSDDPATWINGKSTNQLPQQYEDGKF